MSDAARPIECTADEGFTRWMAEAGGTLAVSTYQAGKLVLIGWNGQQVTVLPRDFQKPMGLAVDGTRLALACQHEVILFTDAPPPASCYPVPHAEGYDTVFLPHAVYQTGDMNIHDIAFSGDDLWMVNTRFSCLSSLTDRCRVQPQWHPPFVSKLVPEDRCHLNGMAMLNGRPKYVTAHGDTDVKGAWKSDRAKGGVLLDVESGETVMRDFCMPHSPRHHAGHWWTLNSGRGELCVVDPESGTMGVVCALPGYVRGLCFTDHHAIVGLSKIRTSHLFDGLPLQERFTKLFCAVVVVDLGSGKEVGRFQFTGGCEELYDVQFIPGRSRAAIAMDSDCRLPWRNDGAGNPINTGMTMGAADEILHIL